MAVKYSFTRAIVAGAIALAAATPAFGQDAVEQFYKGKQINIVIGSDVGGGYDSYARLIARYLGNYIPGKPNIVPQNMPGAGSNKAASYVYGLAAKDGTVIGAPQPGAILQPLLGEAPVQHDPSKSIYVGSANSDVYLCLARADAPAKSFQETFTKEITLGASGQGATTRDLPMMLNNVLGTKLRLVSGYAGTREITLAIERGEVHGICGLGWTSLAATHPDWLTNGTIRILAQETTRGQPDMNKMGVPLALSFAKTDEDRQVMELVYSQGLFGRPYLLPPGVPPERVAALRKAFMAVLQDKDLLADARKAKLDIEALSGEEVQAMVAKAYALSPNVVARAKQSLLQQ
jgi:tripartite-type tricarboxylate transporter receptor subunit TctC